MKINDLLPYIRHHADCRYVNTCGVTGCWRGAWGQKERDEHWRTSHPCSCGLFAIMRHDENCPDPDTCEMATCECCDKEVPECHIGRGYAGTLEGSGCLECRSITR